jgi:DHA2 family multidrug resistance protein
MLTVCAMSATVMQALDTTIANVALPYMQGSLGASQDQINWVLTSYIVAAAVLTLPVSWISERFGRKRLFVVCAAGFTVASLLCGVAQTIEQMVLFRLLQGSFGAALARAFDEKVESTIVDSHDGANRIQDPHWYKGGQS